ncbi:hypothetical protein RJ640_020384 [Escallonia rubra]|uniref:Uncharacterized protein n=1 Tax=Escallonia rubra TaxID=112253 RepID=A0AA88QFI8_9ASTE|nr:hypothetical protein RJ640_020384 [Escallonia rubra]
MALRLLSTPSPTSSSSQSHLTSFFFSSRSLSRPHSVIQRRSRAPTFSRRLVARACVKLEEEESAAGGTGSEWGKVSAVLFDMDGVLCDSEEPSRLAAVDVFAEMGVEVAVEDFVPFMGTADPTAPVAAA